MSMKRVKTDTYEGKKRVLVVCDDCPKFECFSPYNFNRYGEQGHKGPDWRCRRNYYRGCPDNPQIAQLETYQNPKK